MAVAEEELQIWVAAIDSVIYANEPQRHLDPVAVGSSAIHSLNNAVRGGHKVACCLLGMCHLKVQLAPHLGEFFEASTEKGFELLKQSADAEYVPAVYQLSECYRLGVGSAVDAAQAAKLMKKIADPPHNFQAAQRQYGIMFYEGCGVEQSYQRAVQWFQKASQQDDVEAVVRLGLCYQLGLGGLELGIKNALDLYEVASMKGHPFAHACIGRAYECGEGHRWDPPMALKHYTAAADGGDPMGRVGAAWLLLTGGGGYIEVDKPRGLQLLKDGAQAGCREAQYLVSQFHLNPQIGGKVNIKKGMEFLTKAADGAEGLPLAKYTLAQAHHFGHHELSPDLKKALALYESAAAAGHSMAKTRAAAIQKQIEEEEAEEEAKSKKKGKK
mmetsp:Transcript_9626/g.24501  ORF Transcript_9626/g.24501 Transcript_9626/m.24501 type:complete len:385 (+) Transcript_9626:92-1246(+)